MKKNADKAADDLMAAIAAIFDIGGCEVFRFTPSIRYGRRHLGIEDADGYTYMLQVDVIASPDDEYSPRAYS